MVSSGIGVLLFKVGYKGALTAMVEKGTSPTNVGFLYNLLHVHIAIEKKFQFAFLCRSELHDGSK